MSLATKGETIRLADGRALAYAEWTPSRGFPVFFLHGTPGSRLLRPDEAAAAEHGVRLITVERPGYGRSDPKPRRTVAGWADDLAELADALDVDRFAVVGWSGGGPHALACGARLAERARVAVAGAPAPLAEMESAEAELSERDRELVALARRDLDGVVPAMHERGRWLLELAEQPDAFFTAERPEADQAVVAGTEAGRSAPVWLRESARQGLAGYIWDWLAVRLDWGFSLADVRAPVHVWHGALDGDNPPSRGEFIARRIPDARLTVWPGEGHWGIFPRWREVLPALVE